MKPGILITATDERYAYGTNPRGERAEGEAAEVAACGEAGEQSECCRQGVLAAGSNHLGEPAYGRAVLENGVRVITEAIPGVRSVSIGVIVDCGPKDEWPEQAGLAHLGEHLLFQGTCARNTLEIARQVESFGHAGGFTARDYTCYFAATLDDYQFHALDLLGDVLLNSTFPDDCVARERQAILSEIERCWDMPSQHVHDLAKSHALPDQALGRPIAGTAETVARHTREDVIYFLQQHYTPDRIIIAAAGHLDHGDFTAQCRDAFWRLLGQSESAPVKTPIFQGGVTVECTSSAQAYFCLLTPAPEYAAPERYAVHLLNWILGGGISSRLYGKLRDQMGLVYEIHSEYHAYRDGGVISVEGSTSPNHLEEVIAAVLDTVAGLFSGAEPVSPDELWRAKTHLRIQHSIASEDVHTRMCRLATQELYFGRYLDAETILEHIDAVDSGAVCATICKRLFPRLRNAHLVVAGPVGDSRAVADRLASLMDRKQ
jgi:predicted Zn-dependent peptidase